MPPFRLAGSETRQQGHNGLSGLTALQVATKRELPASDNGYGVVVRIRWPRSRTSHVTTPQQTSGAASHPVTDRPSTLAVWAPAAAGSPAPTISRVATTPKSHRKLGVTSNISKYGIGITAFASLAAQKVRQAPCQVTKASAGRKMDAKVRRDKPAWRME